MTWGNARDVRPPRGRQDGSSAIRGASRPSCSPLTTLPGFCRRPARGDAL